MACLWDFGVLQHRNETNFGENSFRHFTAYLGTSSAKVIKPLLHDFADMKVYNLQ